MVAGEPLRSVDARTPLACSARHRDFQSVQLHSTRTLDQYTHSLSQSQAPVSRSQWPPKSTPSCRQLAAPTRQEAERDAAPFLRSTVATNRRCARVNCDVRIGLILAPHLAGRSYHFCVLAQRGCCGAPDGFSQRSFRPGVLRSVPPPDVYLTQLAFVRRPPHRCGVAAGENLSLFSLFVRHRPRRGVGCQFVSSVSPSLCSRVSP